MGIEAKYKFYRKLALVALFSFLFELFAPTAALALTSGPTQPEFSSFEPVATTNMVNEFTGDFTYNLPVINIPGANGGGYALSLAYHSGASPEEEASWVGYGWTLNPGSVTRNKRGFPDDWKGANVKYWNMVPANQTVSIGAGITGEIFSYKIPASANGSIRYNNYQGFGYNAGIGLKLGHGVVSLGYNISDGEGSFSLSVNPAALLNESKEKGKFADGTKLKYLKTKKERRDFLKEKRRQNRGESGIGKLNLIGSNYGIATFSGAERATQITEYFGQSYSLKIGLLPTLTGLEGGGVISVSGSYSRQKNLPGDTPNELTSYGYMYSKGASSSDEAMMDYYVEKESTYNKRDKFLGIPFNNADNYTITGEGIGGGFRMYNKKAGHFRPNQKKSSTLYFDLGFEVEAGFNFGGGADISGGYQTLEVKEWGANGSVSFADPDDVNEDEAVLFRFNNDLGGSVDFGSSEKERAEISYGSTFPGFKTASASVSGVGNPTLALNNGARSSRSSYVGYNTIEKMNETTGNIHYKAYSKYAPLNAFVNKAESNLQKQIGEISTVNEDGQRYTYGLPVYSRFEKNLQIDLAGLGAGSIQSNYLAFKDITNTNNIKTKVGEERDNPYATAYLLTEITGTDYIDRTHNGPTEDDFGGYTRFSYERLYGSDTKSSGGNWYQWRIPYRGLLYNRGSLSDPKDDLGSVIEGEKEIYYLDSIITKTHFAVFDNSDRVDGKDASKDAASASSGNSATGANTLKKLDRILLFAGQPNGVHKLIKTVNFSYDNSLTPGAPNSTAGKLTLKKVWFEYEGVVSAKISPYQFEYAYPVSAQADYPSPYNSLENSGNGLVENSSYSPFNLDAWGNYQSDGGTRFADMKHHLNQNPPASFDPAAWQLKVIKLPSGGEIHVQYEQDDYAYVQDKYANVMVSLKETSSDILGSKYYLKLSDLGIDDSSNPLSNPKIQELSKMIQTLYIDKEKRMYFKFLYKLIGPFQPELSHCNADYITGYAHVKDVGIDNDGLWVQLGKGIIDYDIPRKVCLDFVKTQRAGKLRLEGTCDASEGVLTGNEPLSILQNFLVFAAGFQLPDAATFCLNVNFGLSYLRVPAVDAKKGGGIRVKRLLMYDKGIESGFPNLYGSEYEYKTYDAERGKVISSGVATNEPGTIREENVLVDFMDRFKQSFVAKVISGRDKKQAEGPIGESIMPAPSVGYSRILIKNIHSGKTSPGYSVKEFFTAKDFPFRADMTDIDDSHTDFLPLPTGLINLFFNNVWLSQGFSFKLNNMHGQKRSTATYSGGTTDSKPALVSLEEYSYFNPGEPLPVMAEFGVVENKPLGKEMDMVFESRGVEDINNNGSIEFDADGGIFGIIILPFGSFFPSYTYTESKLYSHATTKITTYPAVVKSVKKYQDGIVHITDNIAFSPQTGQPIVTKTTDGYHDLSILSNTHNGVYTNYTFPASLQYDHLGPIAKNEKRLVKSGSNGANMSKLVIDGKTWLSFSADAAGESVCDAMNNFVSGDLVKLSNGELYHIGDVEGSKIELHKLSYFGSYSSSASNLNVEIIRSGRSNRLNESAGSLTTYGTDATSTIANVPVPASILAPRSQLAAILTAAIGNENDTIFPSEIPSGLSFTGGDGNCTDSLLTHNQYMLIEGNNLNIYKRTADTVIIGTPSNPHPMADSLNKYFAKYYGYALNPSTTPLNSCGVNPNFKLEGLPFSNTSVAAMRAAEDVDLGVQFNYVNNATHEISDFFQKIDSFEVSSGTIGTNTEFNPTTNSRKNRIVFLGHTASQSVYGRGLFECDTAWVDCKDSCNTVTRYLSCPYECAHLEAEECSEITDNTIQHPPFGAFKQTANGYLWFNSASNDTVFNSNSLPGPNASCVFDIRFYRVDTNPQLICSHSLAMSGGQGHFAVDTNTANLVYFAADNNCFAQKVGCINFCTEAFPGKTIQNVVACNAKTYSDQWPYNPGIYYNAPSGTPNVYETGERGKWRTDADFVFNKNIEGLTAAYTPSSPEKNYNSGTYLLQLFNWKTLQANNSSTWFKLNTVKKYSPDGNALEEENILGIRSAAKFGYNQVVPYLVAQNSDYTSVMFESFEKTYQNGNFFEDGMVSSSVTGTVDATTSHSGQRSLRLQNSAKGVELATLNATTQALSKGLLMKVWVKSDGSTPASTGLKAEIRNAAGVTLLYSANFGKVAKVGEWTLYEAKLTDLSSVLNPNVSFRAYLHYEFSAQHTENVWIDDVRLQPADAQVINYVYDVNTLRLTTSFDDQHFGLFYQYNGEGKLVRKLIETERGIKTVQETQYNTPMVNR